MDDRGSHALHLVLEDIAKVHDASASMPCSHIESLRGHVEFTSAIPINVDDVSIYFEGEMRNPPLKRSLRWCRCF
jgi:hypothetical protein